ncbi:MAG: hypothetical protein AAGG51_30010, partial [Cyanobacteria bacterium P01_G01_bin.54]
MTKVLMTCLITLEVWEKEGERISTQQIFCTTSCALGMTRKLKSRADKGKSHQTTVKKETFMRLTGHEPKGERLPGEHGK